MALLQAGYVVVVPDYLGLSRSGDNAADYHPFLDSATVAQNMTDAVRATLLATAHDLGPRGRDDMFGAGLADAYRALSGQLSPVAAEMPVQRIPVNSGVR